MRGLVPAQSKPRLLPIHDQQAISKAHALPVIFKRGSTNDTDLIMLSIATESWPSKPMRPKFSDESLEKYHVQPSLSHGSGLCGVRYSETVNRFDYHQGALSNYESAVRVRINGSLMGYCNFAYSALASFRIGISGSASFQRVRKSL